MTLDSVYLDYGYRNKDKFIQVCWAHDGQRFFVVHLDLDPVWVSQSASINDIKRLALEKINTLPA